MDADRLERAARAVVDDFPFLTMRDAMKRAQASGSERVPCFLNREHLEALEALRDALAAPEHAPKQADVPMLLREAVLALLRVVDERDPGLRGYYIDAERFNDLRAALAAPEPACAEAAFASDDCPASDAALGSVWVDRDGAAWRKVATAPDASGAVQHYHHAEPKPAQAGAGVKKAVEDALAVAGTRVRGADDATWLLIAYERLCFMVASPESHTSKPDPVDAYGVLRGEIVHLLKAGMVPPNPAQAGEAVEPVAWLVAHKDCPCAYISLASAEEHAGPNEAITPLYAAPSRPGGAS